MVPDKSWNQGESAAKDGAGDRERGRRRVTFDSTRRASGRERVSEDEMDSLTRRLQEVYRGGEREGGVRAEEVEEDVEIGLEQALRLMRRLEREVQKQQWMLQRLADTRSQDGSSGEKPRAELYLPDWQLSAGAVTLRGLKLTAPPETPSALPVRLAPGGLIEWTPIDPKAVYEELGKLVKVEPPWTKIKQTHAESFTEFCDRLQRAIAESDLPPEAQGPVMMECLWQQSDAMTQDILKTIPKGTPLSVVIRTVLQKQNQGTAAAQALVTAVDQMRKGPQRCFSCGYHREEGRRQTGCCCMAALMFIASFMIPGTAESYWRR
ncbi:uncharacterized protein [Apteryx mantelli]|uniref:Retroviral nucleocapsid Gag protein p24 C-terminal domain-containing protein n=1 Tax=Apteryx mantelli TaxID=2696672 RepID=A0ABM4EKK4_9AVES